MTTITITVDGATYSVQREGFDVQTCYDDFLNLMFLSGADLDSLSAILKNVQIGGQPKKDHIQDEDQPISNPCNI